MRLLFLLFITLFSVAVYTQDFKLIKVDNQSFPTIKLSITLNENFNINQLKIVENGEEKLLKIDSSKLHHGVHAICYLIDIDKFNKTEKLIVYNAISKAALSVKAKTLINICVVSSNSEKTCFTPYSYEFTDNIADFIQFAKVCDAKYQNSSDLNCALTQTINFIDEKKYLPKEKTVIVLAKNHERKINFKEILKLGRKKNIRVKFISNADDVQANKYSEFYNIQTVLTEIELANTLMDAGSDKNLVNIQKQKNYIVEFVSEQNDFLNRIEIHYGNDIIKTAFLKPGEDRPVGIVWFFVIMFILIVFIVYLIKKQMSLKRKLLSLKETVSLLFDKKMKILGTQTLTPVIEISLLNDVSNYHIKKIVTTIGRKKNCDLVINNLTISAHHASITNEGGEFYIQDFESTNGVFVNDIKISKKVVKSGDIIRMGKAILTIHY